MTRYNPSYLSESRGHFRLTAADMMTCVWLVYYIVRTWVGNEYPCRTEFLQVIEMALLYFSLRVSFHDIIIPEYFLVLFVVMGGCCEALYGAWQMADGNSRHPLFLLTGSFQNPGPYSAYLMLGLVTGTAAWQSYRHFTVRRNSMKKHTLIALRYIIFCAMIPMCVMLPATWSRAAWFGTVMSALCIFKQCYWKHRYALWSILLIGGAALYLIKRGSADGRILIWLSSVTTWAEAPWFGVGTGGFNNACAEGISSLYKRGTVLSSAGVADNSYNLLVKILVEQGITGAMMAVVLFYIVMVRLHKNSRPLFYGMTSLLLFSMFSYPFDLLPYRIIAITVTAWSESASSCKICYHFQKQIIGFAACLKQEIGFAACQKQEGRRELACIGHALLSCLLVFLAWQAYKLVRESHNADQSYNLIRGNRDKAFIKDYYELLPLEEDNQDFLFDFGKILREYGRYNDSNAILRKGTTCSADPMFHVLIGNNYRDMKRYALAEDSYKKAFAIMPNRLYPLYQLMLMHDDCGEKTKARNIARTIIEMKPKIESPATRDMKYKAAEIMRTPN